MKKYIEINNGLGIFTRNEDIEYILTGIKFNILPYNEKKNHEKYNIQFIFEDNIPNISFYCVPYIEIFAFDDDGFICISNHQVYYINDKCYKIADSIEQFKYNIEHYKDHLILCDDITIYSSKEEAYKELNIIEYKEMNESLLSNLNALHTTKLGIKRIKRNLNIDCHDIVEWCKDKILHSTSIIKKGKNYYVYTDTEIITINVNSYTIITAHKKND